jgi:Domain of unknown function (DUF4326)
MPERIQRKRTKGWRLPPNTICVSRPSRWGNPYRVQDYGREEALRLYAQDLAGLAPAVQAAWVSELEGRDLACWCPVGDLCHADMLLRIVNPRMREGA